MRELYNVYRLANWSWTAFWVKPTKGFTDMSKDYVTHVNGAYRISGTRVSLDSVVHAFLNGLSPESISEAEEWVNRLDSIPL